MIRNDNLMYLINDLLCIHITREKERDPEDDVKKTLSDTTDKTQSIMITLRKLTRYNFFVEEHKFGFSQIFMKRRF